MAERVAVRLCFHDRCFDGAASAAVFYRFYRERIHPDAEFHFTGMTHQARQPFEDSLFDGDENVIVDFKYSSSPRVTWWFDHHQSAFLTPADAEHFRADRSGHKFYDPNYKSCTKLLADVTSSKFGFDIKPLAELIHWGDIIDGAQYPTPESAVAIDQPATQLALVIEAAPENGLVPKLIPDLSRHSLAEMIQLPIVAQHLG
ncbi:MAG: phosphoesterase, partial [Candidatus Acidiferrales bacterium]